MHILGTLYLRAYITMTYNHMTYNHMTYTHMTTTYTHMNMTYTYPTFHLLHYKFICSTLHREVHLVHSSMSEHHPDAGFYKLTV